YSHQAYWAFRPGQATESSTQTIPSYRPSGMREELEFESTHSSSPSCSPLLGFGRALGCVSWGIAGGTLAA
ncbi:hypothetical protein FCV25MIE_34558, partial [Fagus crenata]